MNKPRRHTSKIIQKIQQERSAADFEKTKKRMLLAAKIADGLKARGWKNGDLARELDQHNSVISKWLSGTHNFTTDTLFDIERALGITLINYVEYPQQEIVQHYELTVSVKADDLIGNEYSGIRTWDKELQSYIFLCGGLAVSAASTIEK